MDVSRVGAVIVAQVALLIADATLIGAPLLNGAHVYYRMTSELVQRIPSVQYYLLDVGIEETWETAIVRWEIWGQTFARVMAIEKQLRLLLHYDGNVTLGGSQVTSQFQQSYDAADAAQPSYMRRIVETELKIVRLRAA